MMLLVVLVVMRRLMTVKVDSVVLGDFGVYSSLVAYEVVVVVHG